jgi:deazaflavin-dependent oxidoreductase (nitroreductase family)
VDLDGRPAPTPFSERTGLLAVRFMEATNISLFRLSKGKVGGTIFGAPVVLLTTSGRTTGIRRTKPLLALEDGISWIVVGSRGGTSSNPDWYENLVAYKGSQADATPRATHPCCSRRKWSTPVIAGSRCNQRSWRVTSATNGGLAW